MLLVGSVSMELGLAISSPNARSITTGGNLWRRKHSSTKNIYYANSHASKVSQHKRKSQEYKFLRFQQPNLNQHYKCTGGGSTCQKCNGKYAVKVNPKPVSDSDHTPYFKNFLDSIKNLLAVFFMFSRPYAMIVQAISMISASLLAVEKLSDISPLFFIGVLQVVVPNLFMTLYVNGVNQLSDIEIDKINKPYLPLASGQISFTTGVTTAASCLALSFWLGWITGSWALIWNLLLCCLLWTAYSINVPLLRWKGHPILSAMCMLVTWAVIFPISGFLHMQTFVLERPVVFSRSLIFVVAFMIFYSGGMVLYKDIPDIEGDSTFGIYSFAARLGLKRAFWISISLFQMAFGVILLGGALSPYLWIKIVTVLGHVVLSSVLWYQAKSIDLRSKASIASFYVFIWKLLAVEYFIMPLVR